MRRTASRCSAFSRIGERNIAAIPYHEYKVYLAVENIDHTRTKAKSPQHGIIERYHKTIRNEFYPISFRKKIYATIGELQQDLDHWMAEYNELRPYQGRYCIGKTPMQTFFDTRTIAQDKQIRPIHRQNARLKSTGQFRLSVKIK